METFETEQNSFPISMTSVYGPGLINNSYNLICKSISTKNAKILGNRLCREYFQNTSYPKRPDFKNPWKDLPPNMIALAEKEQPNRYVLNLDCRPDQYTNTLYDGIVCGFCLALSFTLQIVFN